MQWTMLLHANNVPEATEQTNQSTLNTQGNISHISVWFHTWKKSEAFKLSKIYIPIMCNKKGKLPGTQPH